MFVLCFSVSAFGGDFGRRGGLTSGFAGDGKKFRDSELGGRLHQPKWDLARLQKFEKFFYHEHPAVANRSTVSRHILWNLNFSTSVVEYTKWQCRSVLVVDLCCTGKAKHFKFGVQIEIDKY